MKYSPLRCNKSSEESFFAGHGISGQGEINKFLVNTSYSNSSSKSLRQPRHSDFQKR
jgi:hypothetical protein